MFAPFASPSLVWDFRIKRVSSINTSGHSKLSPVSILPRSLRCSLFRLEYFFRPFESLFLAFPRSMELTDTSLTRTEWGKAYVGVGWIVFRDKAHRKPSPYFPLEPFFALFSSLTIFSSITQSLRSLSLNFTTSVLCVLSLCSRFRSVFANFADFSHRQVEYSYSINFSRPAAPVLAQYLYVSALVRLSFGFAIC